MIDKAKLEEAVAGMLEGSDCYLVEVNVSPSNEISVVIDSDGAVDIEECVRLTRAIEQEFDRDKEDYDLEVGSAGLTTPFRVLRQYRKFIGEPVEVVLSDGRKLKGVLSEAEESGFCVVVREKVRHEGEKRPKLEDVEYRFAYSEVKSVAYDPVF